MSYHQYDENKQFMLQLKGAEQTETKNKKERSSVFSALFRPKVTGCNLIEVEKCETFTDANRKDLLKILTNNLEEKTDCYENLSKILASLTKNNCKLNLTVDEIDQLMDVANKVNIQYYNQIQINLYNLLFREIAQRISEGSLDAVVPIVGLESKTKYNKIMISYLKKTNIFFTIQQSSM